MKREELCDGLRFRLRFLIGSMISHKITYLETVWKFSESDIDIGILFFDIVDISTQTGMRISREKKRAL